MERLSGLDASFLYLESPQQLMHVCGLILLDPSTMARSYDFDSFKARLEARAREIPMFTRKLRRVPLRLDHPLWVPDPDFDIDHHVHRLAAPTPGGAREVAEIVGDLAGIGLDRSRPLWEMWVVEGLASGQIAVVTKMHHVSVDGVNGANVLSYLCSLEPDAPLLDPVPSGAAGRVVDERIPGNAELIGRALLANAAKPVEFAKLLAPTTGLLADAIGRARRGEAMAAPLTAPRTSFNGTITGHRSVAYADLGLDRIREIKKVVDGATVNDVVLAMSGGALRRYLKARGELPTTSLIASVPVSVHETSRRTGGSNKVSSLFARLGTDIADPLARIRALAVANARAKEHHKAIPADTLQDWAQFAAPRTFGLAVRMVAGLGLAERGPVIHNLVVSNVPGPPVPLYFLGARIDGLYPLGPIFHGAGLNITVMSNNGQMHVGIIGCRESIPRVWDLAADFPAELDALYAAAVG